MKNTNKRSLVIGVISMMVLFTNDLMAQKTIYNEANVPNYTLPELLVLKNGQKVEDAKTWHRVRRPQILQLFQSEVYGKCPPRPPKMKFKVTSTDSNALGGKAIRKEVTVYFDGSKTGPQMDLLIYLPKNAKSAVPAFVGLNFYGNHTIQSDPKITLSKQWMRSNPKKHIKNHRATEASRGISASRWPVETIIARGYAVATIYCGDIDPDYHDGFKNGVHRLTNKDGKTKPAADQWGTISAWAWGLSRALDYFETDQQIDQKRVVVIGHSRLGKTALWASARDQRFAMAISNNSGCGGAALSRRRFGETVKIINTAFPHWFCGNFKKYNGKEDELPVDQHMLVALSAPRPVYIASSEKDRWADPHGEFLSAKGADPVYRLLGTSGLKVKKWPKLNTPTHGQLGYHIRSGKHDINKYDWQQHLNFADLHLKKENRLKEK